MYALNYANTCTYYKVQSISYPNSSNPIILILTNCSPCNTITIEVIILFSIIACLHALANVNCQTDFNQNIIGFACHIIV